MTTNQEQMIEAAARAIAERNGFSFPTFTHRADARDGIAAIHPTVTTVEELDALPVGTVGIDEDGDGFYVGFYGACIVDYDPCIAPSPSVPATVLHIPGGAA